MSWLRTHPEGRGKTEKNLNDNLETPHLAPTLFSHQPGFYLITGILNPSPFLGHTQPSVQLPFQAYCFTRNWPMDTAYTDIRKKNKI